MTTPFATLPDGTTTTVVGTLTRWQRRVSKQGRPYGEGIALSDDGESVDVDVFPVPYAAFGELIAEGERRTWTGFVDPRGDGSVLLVRKLTSCQGHPQ